MAFKFLPCWWKAKPVHCQSPCGEWIFITLFSSFSLILIHCSTEWMGFFQRVLIQDRMYDIQFSIKNVLWRFGLSCLKVTKILPFLLWSYGLFLFLIEYEFFDCLNWLLLWFRLDAPSLRGSFTSSSWPLSPGCVLRGSSCTSCSWRSLRVNIHGKSTTTCRVTSFLPSWSVSPQLSTTRAMGPRKRKCNFLSKSLEMQSRHAGCFIVWVYLLCLYMAAFEKKSTHHFCQRLMCIPGDYTKTFELLLPGMGGYSIFYVIWKWLTDSTLWFQRGRSYINAFLLKDPPVTSCL